MIHQDQCDVAAKARAQVSDIMQAHQSKQRRAADVAVAWQVFLHFIFEGALSSFGGLFLDSIRP